MHVIKISLAGIAICVATVGIARALDRSDLAALQVSVREMCVQPDRKGNYLNVSGDLTAGATLRVAGVEARGKISQDQWDGISQRLDEYKTDPRQCAISIITLLAPLLNSPPEAKACRDPSHGIERYEREFNVTRQSAEMGGGHGQAEWCNNAIAILRGEHPGAAFTVVSSGERTRNHCPPANCPQYTYICTINVRASPVYIEKVSSACR